jgi:hypothetical protein
MTTAQIVKQVMIENKISELEAITVLQGIAAQQNNEALLSELISMKMKFVNI